MNTFDDDLLAALRRSPDPADRRVAELLATAAPGSGPRTSGPRANDALATFLVGADATSAALGTDAPVDAASRGDLVVHIGPAPARPARRAVWRLPALPRARTAANALLGAALVLGGGVAALAASGSLPDGRPDSVVVTPTSDQSAPADQAERDPAADADGSDGTRGPEQDPAPAAESGATGRDSGADGPPGDPGRADGTPDREARTSGQPGATANQPGDEDESERDDGDRGDEGERDEGDRGGEGERDEGDEGDRDDEGDEGDRDEQDDEGDRDDGAPADHDEAGSTPGGADDEPAGAGGTGSSEGDPTGDAG